LDHPGVRQAEHADATVARVQEHVTVEPQRLPQAAVPAITLTTERLRVRWHLRPAHRVDHELEAVRLLAVAEIAVQTDGELEVLAHRARLEATGREERAAAKDPERARDRDQRVDLTHGASGGQEGAE